MEGVSRLVLKQMPAEVAIARRRLRCNDGKVVRQGRQGQFLLHLQIPSGGEFLDGLLLRQRLLPHREGRVDVIDKQGQPEHRVKIDLHPHQDGNSRLQRLPGLGLKEGLQLRDMARTSATCFPFTLSERFK